MDLQFVENLGSKRSRDLALSGYLENDNLASICILVRRNSIPNPQLVEHTIARPLDVLAAMLVESNTKSI